MADNNPLFSKKPLETHHNKENLSDNDMAAPMFSTLAAHLAEAQEMERRQLARALHDEVGQNVTAIGFTLDFIQSQLSEPGLQIDIVGTYLKETLNLVEQTTDRIRQIVTDLRPPMLDEYGLIEALDWYAEHLTQETGLKITVQPAYFAPRLPATVESMVFRIVQEALTNIINHAQANQTSIMIEAKTATLRLTITDDGRGFDIDQQTASPTHYGLLTMAERAKAVNGRCHIESRLDEGTRVIIEVPR